MPLFEVETIEKFSVLRKYQVEADSKEEAEEMIQVGDLPPTLEEPLSDGGEIVDFKSCEEVKND